MSGFSGLYYPGESWDLEVEDSMLKKCLLFFDRIYAIVPEVFSVDWQDVQPYDELATFLRDVRRFSIDRERKVRAAIEAGNIQLSSRQKKASLHELARHARITRFMDKIALLRKEGLVELVNPRENLLDPPYWCPKEKDPYPWMHINADYEATVKQGVELEHIEDYKPHILYGSILSDLRDKQFRKVADKLGSDRVIVYKGQAEQNWLAALGGVSGFSKDEWQHFPSLVCYFGFSGTVSTAMWAALVVNHALLTAHKYELIPATPNPIFYELSQSKLRRLRVLSQGPQFRQRYPCHPEYEAGFSGFTLAACTLPNLEIKSFEDVLELRLALHDELIAFREQMVSFAERVRVESWEPHFQSEIEYVVKHRIQPAVNDLQRKLEGTSKDVSLQAMKNVASAPTGLSILATIWAGMPPLIVMAVTAGLVSVETALGYHFERRKILQNNGLSLLLRLS